jgi:hypothetical protein
LLGNFKILVIISYFLFENLQLDHDHQGRLALLLLPRDKINENNEFIDYTETLNFGQYND